jgi:LCP family protein required for cell wall assembly
VSTAAPARPRGGKPAASVVNPYPIRYPDSSSAAFMGRRAWWLVAVNFLVPGSAQVLAGNRRLGRIGLGATLIMWVLAVAGILLALLWRGGLLAVVTNWFVLLVLQALMLAYAVVWLVLTLDTLRLVRLVRLRPLTRIATALVTIVLMVLASGGAVYAAGRVGIARDAIGDVFTQTGPVVAPVDGYYNILLLGADSGEGRDSMRYDSISVVSVNADTGAVTIFGIPRDMPNVPFAEGPMQELYPDGHSGHSDSSCGWGSGINQLRTEVEVCRDGDELYPDAVVAGSEPGIEATKDAAEGVLGIEIPYYVFIDMDGFAALIDALGGVDITVNERLPEGWGPTYEGQPADEWAIGWIETGAQHMDGDTAQWYARSRYTTSDWDRMERQRQLQEAILGQFNPANVLTRFQEVAAAGTHLVQTDIPQSMLGYFVDLGIKAKEHPVTTFDLVPANGVDYEDPDYAEIQARVNEMLHPPTATTEPAE